MPPIGATERNDLSRKILTRFRRVLLLSNFVGYSIDRFTNSSTDRGLASDRISLGSLSLSPLASHVIVRWNDLSWWFSRMAWISIPSNLIMDIYLRILYTQAIKNPNVHTYVHTYLLTFERMRRVLYERKKKEPCEKKKKNK